jgi:hypothetical protein
MWKDGVEASLRRGGSSGGRRRNEEIEELDRQERAVGRRHPERWRELVEQVELGDDEEEEEVEREITTTVMTRRPSGGWTCQVGGR